MTETQSSAPGEMPADFDAKQQAWYKAVASVFARVQKKDVADVPLDVWKKLIKTTYDGIDVKPLYTRADELVEQSEPGTFPFIRAGHVNSADRAGWGVTETFGTTGDAVAANKELLHALANGTTDVVLDLTGTLTAADLPSVLQGVYLDLVPMRLKAGDQIAEAATALYTLIDAAGAAETAYVELSASPLTATITGDAPTVSLEEATSLAIVAAQRPGTTRAMLVDGVAFSNQGATDAQEIGMSLAVGVEYLRALTAAGLSIEDALEQITFRFAASDEQFDQIAKFRASRGLWARVAEVLGAPEAGRAPQHAVTAPVMFSQRDPWVNMLRCTVAAFAAGVGGANDVEVLPFDYAIPGGLPDTSRSFAHRIARNTNLLLLEESHLGFVVDPAGGSYFVEDLTTELADKAWEVFTSIEAEGGFCAAWTAGSISTALNEAHKNLQADVASRKKKITGINEFPNLGEKPLDPTRRTELEGVRRWAAEFEMLRNRSDVYLENVGVRPRISLIPLGPLAKHNVRTGFATNLLASGGIEALNPGQVEPGTEEFEQAARSAPIAVICGTDAEYAENGLATVAALKELGVDMVLLAGAPSVFPDTEDAALPDDYLNLKINAAATLAGLLQKLGA